MLRRFLLSTPLLLTLVVALGVARVGAQEPPPAPAEPVTVFFLRHAEKGNDDPRDPGLSEEGGERARALARVLGGAGVTHLYSSEYRRTRDTLGPLAERAGVEVVTVSARKPPEQLDALRSLPPGSVAVVAGHSNTTPRLVESLSGKKLELEPEGRTLGEDEYDRLFVVTLAGVPEVAAELLDLRYGE